MATVSGNATSGLYGIGLNAQTPVGNNYGNSNVAAFLTTYNGNLTAGQITVPAGNIFGNAILASEYYWANGTPIQDTWYTDLSVADYLPTYTGDIAATLTEGTQLGIVAVGPQVNLTAASNVSIGNFWINNLQDPINAQDGATKNYVDSIAQGVNLHAAADLATGLPLPSYVYNNGNAGIGATIQGLLVGLLQVDGVIPQVGDRILVKNELLINTPYQGLYTVTQNSIGATYQLVRSSDLDQPTDFYGAYIFVVKGNSNANTSWLCINSPSFPIVIGTTPLNFEEISSGGGGNSVLSAGEGINFGNNQVSVNTDGVTTFINGSNAVSVDLVNYTGNIGSTGQGYYFGNIAYASGGGGGSGGNGQAIINGTSNVAITTLNGPIKFSVNNLQQGYISQNNIAFGLEAGNVNSPSSNTINIGYHAGRNDVAGVQGNQTVAIGGQAGYDRQGDYAVALGYQSGMSFQGAFGVAVGRGSGVNSGYSSVNLGPYTNGGGNSISIGALATSNTAVSSIITLNATGVSQPTPNRSGFYVSPVTYDTANVTYGMYYNVATNEITYALAGNGGGNGGGNVGSSLINGSYNFTLQSDGSLIMPNPNGSTLSTLLKSQNDSVSFGPNTALTGQSYQTVAIGYEAGKTNQQNSSVAIGSQAGKSGQGIAAVAIGYQAGTGAQAASSVAIGVNSISNGTYSTAIGAGAQTYGTYSTAIGYGANAPGANAVVINGSATTFTGGSNGFFVKPVRNDLVNVTQSVYYNASTGEMTYGPTGGGNAIIAGNKIANGTSNVSIPTTNGSIYFTVGGTNVGRVDLNATSLGPAAGDTNQGGGAVAIGTSSGTNNQGSRSIAIGSEAGFQTQAAQSIAIGYQAGYGGGTGQGTQSVAIGTGSGATSQGAYSVGLGYNAGWQLQGNYAVALGPNAGTLNQPSNSILINASSSVLNGTNSGLYINPIRNDDTNISVQLFYNTTTKEITWSNAGNPLGVDQSYQSPVRNSGNIYQNLTGSPIFVVISITASGSCVFSCSNVSPPSSITSNLTTGTYSFIVPNNFYYSLSTGTVNSWKELS